MRTLGLMILAGLAALFASYLTWGELLETDSGWSGFPILAFRARRPPTEVAALRVEEARRPVVTRVYDIRDLIIDIPNFVDVPDFSLQHAAGQQPPPPSSWHVGLERVREWLTFSGDAEGVTREGLIESIVNGVKDDVEPGSWGDDGASVGGIRELQGHLIVTHTQAGQAEVARWLERERAWRPAERFARQALPPVVGAMIFAGLADVLWRWQRRGRRRRRGECAACGYDLRATPAGGRCPECGHATPPDRAASAVPSPTG